MRSKFVAIAIMCGLAFPAGARSEEQEVVLQADLEHVVRPLPVNSQNHNEKNQNSFYGLDSVKSDPGPAGKKGKG